MSRLVQHLVIPCHIDYRKSETSGVLSSATCTLEMSLTFLDLPPTVRHKIYDLAGLIRPCPIDIVEEGRRMSRRMQLDARWYEHTLEDFCSYPWWRTGRKERFFDGDLECFCPALPIQLLRVSRSMHREVENILYSQNRFKLLPLKIEGPEEKLDLEPFLRLSSNALAALRCLHIELGPCHTELIRLCKVLSAQSTPSQLSFSLSLEFPSNFVPGILDPLEDLAGLKDCAISLSRTIEEDVRGLGRIDGRSIFSLRPEPSKELRELAKFTALRLTRPTALPSKPFPFARLPAEVRAQILYFVHVGPSSNGIEIRNHRICPPRSCCVTCTPTLSICACWSRKAAYSTTCSCYSPPLSLFYVSRLMNTEATYSYFSHNRFIVGHMSFKETLEFFRSLSPLAVRSIRSLDLKIFDWQLRYWHNAKFMEPNQCYALAEFIAENFDLPRLHLYLVSSFMPGPEYDFEWVREVQWALVEPMRLLRGLKRFHVYQSMFSEDEAEMERSVMGENYDATEDGKLVGRPRNGDFPPPWVSGVARPTIPS